MTKAFTFLLCSAFLVFFIWFSSFGIANNKLDISRHVSGHKNLVIEKTRAKAAQARTFIRQKNYNDQICFLVDMSEPSSKNRFFVYDLKKDTLRNAGLVTHGNCFKRWLDGRRYGNKVGCGCTSLGRYRSDIPIMGIMGWLLSYMDWTAQMIEPLPAMLFCIHIAVFRKQKWILRSARVMAVQQ